MNQHMFKGLFFCRSIIILASVFLFGFQSAYAATSTTQVLTLAPGWNVVSTPRLLESHVFSLPETLSNFAIYTLDPSRTSGWATMADLGQTQFVPLFGYFVNNKSTTSQTLTFNFRASTTPNERLFDRSFVSPGWYSIGVANPTYADRQSEINVDENNPAQVFGSLLNSMDLVVDFTDANALSNASSVAMSDPWRATTASDTNSLADIRDTKGYAIYINKPGAHYVGFQNESDDGASTSLPVYKLGTLSLIKAADSASGNVPLGGTGVSFGMFSIQASGEKLKIENLTVAFTSSNPMWGKIRNAALFANGVQIGSTQDIKATGTQFNLGSALVVSAGQNISLEIRGDVFDADGVNDVFSGDVFQIKLLAGTSNVFRMTTGDYISSTSTSANALIVSHAQLSLYKYSAFASQTVTVPQNSVKIGEYRLSTGSTDGVILDTITLGLNASGGVANISDVYVVYNGKTSEMKAVGSAFQTFTTSEVLDTSSTIPIVVYASISGNAVGDISTTLSVSGASQASGATVRSSTANGQLMTIGTTSLSVVTDASTPVSAIVVGGTMPLVGAYKFTASNDAFTVVDISATTTNSSAIVELVFKDGSTELGRQPFNGTSLTKAGLNVAIPANTSKVISVYANLGSVGTNAGTSGSNIRVTLTSVKYRDSNGVETTDSYAAGVMGNSMYVYKTKPTITNVALPTSVLNAGTQTVAQFTVTADAAGTVAWRQIKLNIASSAPSSFVTTSGYAIYDAANQSTSLTGITVTQTASSVTFTSSVDQEVSGSKTYVVKALVGGNVVTGASLSHSIPTVATAQTAPVAYASVPSSSSFIWSDEALTPHSATSADWSDDFLVKNLPTDSLTLAK